MISGLFHVLGIGRVAVTSSLAGEDHSFVYTGVPLNPSYQPRESLHSDIEDKGFRDVSTD